MAAKKKNILQRNLHPDTESVAIGSAMSILIAVMIKSMLVAIPLGLVVAFAHKYGISKAKKDKK